MIQNEDLFAVASAQDRFVAPSAHAEQQPRELDLAELRSPLGQELVGANVITVQDLERALSEQSEKGLRLGETLIDLGLVQEDQLLPYIEKHLGVPAVRLREGLVDPRVVQLLPKETAELLSAVAVFKLHDSLFVAMTDPQDLQSIDEIERLTGLQVRGIFAFRSNIERILSRCYEEGFEVDALTADLDAAAVELKPESVDVDLASVEALVDGSPVINLVNYFLVQAVREKASDIHIEPGRKTSTVRFRVDGQMHEVVRPRAELHPAMVSRVKVISKMDIAEHYRPQDGRFQVAVDGREIDFRVSTLPTVLGEKVVLRILDRDSLTFNLDELGIPRDMLGRVKTLLSMPHGLLLVTGPTGSGKTTTLYSALELIKSVHRNIVTVEDPVEYQIELVNQVQVDASRQFTFATALRSILRQDPDVIMVGEIRDAETAQIALQAALTGHLVLSTLHTNDAAGAIIRLRDMGLASYKVAAALTGVIAQRLLRTICPECESVFYPPTELLEAIHYQGDRRRAFARGEGCANCHDTGFRGRVGIYEVLQLDGEMRGSISAEADLADIRRLHRNSGGRFLLDEGISVAEAERTSLDEVMRVAFVE